MPTKLAKAFGTALREYREKRDMSLLDLSLESEVHRTYIWELEHGRKNASLETAFRLAKALGVPAAELIKMTSKHLD